MTFAHVHYEMVELILPILCNIPGGHPKVSDKIAYSSFQMISCITDAVPILASPCQFKFSCLGHIIKLIISFHPRPHCFLKPHQR